MADELSVLLKRTMIRFVPNGVDLKQFQNHGKSRKKQIAAIGLLKWQKGYEYLLEAMRLITDQDREVKLVIAGEGPLEEELRQKVDALRLNDQVSFLGTIDHPEVVELFNTSSVFVLFSVSEGFPKVLLEAMACGTPVVVTDVGECTGVVGDAGCVVPPRSAVSLAEKIFSLITDRSEWAKRSKGASERVRCIPSAAMRHTP